jgi:CRISPR-associated endoribonuclease Cas6
MLCYIKIDVVLKKDTQDKPHFFLGSTLRGAFGLALKKVVCINPAFDCEDCFASNNCLFHDFYERKNHIHAYRFSKELGSNNYNFSFYLFESATDKLPYVLSAIYKMVHEVGLGIDRKKYQIQSITCNNEKVYENGQFNLEKAKTEKCEISNFHSGLRLKFLTPLRIKSENKLARNTIDLKQILQSIQNRLCELKNEEKAKLTFEPQYKLIKSDIKFLDLSRYSNRQKTKMKFGGLIGEMIFDEVDEQSFQLLKIAEIIGVGKQTVFGLGEIKIT